MREVTVKDLHSTPSESIRVMLFNVGQGDHMLLRFPDGEYGIIDFFYAIKAKIVEPPALSYFKALRRFLSQAEFERITISFVCISHMDSDHVKGLAESVRWFSDSGVFVRDFWLGASIDKAQLVGLLRDKVGSMVKRFDLVDRIRYQGEILKFGKNVRDFFQYYDNWQKKKFPRSSEAGTGEYLVEIRPLPRPCSLTTTEAVNLGPLSRHLERYLADITLDVVKGILGVNDPDNVADRNVISHILRIRHGERNLTFGGDTHREIWENCLDKYLNPHFPFVNHHGPVESHFVKVSHHGSKNSSSATIWEKLIPKGGTGVLGISAGRHDGYKHPHSETIGQIRQIAADTTIVSTNACTPCLAAYPSEHHVWYEDYVDRNASYGKAAPNSNDKKIDGVIRRITVAKAPPQKDLGLLAFIFDIPPEFSSEITISVALTSKNSVESCFFSGHEHQLFEACGGQNKEGHELNS